MRLNPLTCAALVTVLLFGVIVLLSLLLMLRHAAGSPSCMTKDEARKIYRSKHLYWHTAQRCWDATPVGQRRRIMDPPVPLPEARPSLLGIHWQAKPFAAAAPWSWVLQPADYYPTIKPDPQLSDEVVYSENEYTWMDAQARELPPPPPEAAPLYTARGGGAVNFAVAFIGLCLLLVGFSYSRKQHVRHMWDDAARGIY